MRLSRLKNVVRSLWSLSECDGGLKVNVWKLKKLNIIQFTYAMGNRMLDKLSIALLIRLSILNDVFLT